MPRKDFRRSDEVHHHYSLIIDLECKSMAIEDEHSQLGRSTDEENECAKRYIDLNCSPGDIACHLCEGGV